jgi:hypothetical protein
MKRILWLGVVCIAYGVAFVVLADVARAGTIIKLNLGGDNSTDIGYDGNNLSTLDDGGANPGNQDTAVDFLDILSPLPDIPSPQASFSLNGLAKSGLASVVNNLVIQNFSGGTLKLYGPGPAFDLLLQGTLGTSALAGPIGAPATGALFTTSFATVTGGTLAPALDANFLTLSMSLGNINNGVGLGVADVAPILLPFLADATLNLADSGPGPGGNGPEPSTIVLAMIGFATLGAFAKGRRDAK